MGCGKEKLLAPQNMNFAEELLIKSFNARCDYEAFHSSYNGGEAVCDNYNNRDFATVMLF